MPAIDFRIECKERIQRVGNASGEFSKELEKLRFLVSKETYQDLVTYAKTASDLSNKLFNTLAPALCSYEGTYGYSDEFDLLQRGYLETDGTMPVDDYMDGMAKLDDHKDPYIEYKQARRDYDSIYNSISEKFKSKLNK